MKTDIFHHSITHSARLISIPRLQCRYPAEDFSVMQNIYTYIESKEKITCTVATIKL